MRSRTKNPSKIFSDRPIFQVPKVNDEEAKWPGADDDDKNDYDDDNEYEEEEDEPEKPEYVFEYKAGERKSNLVPTPSQSLFGSSAVVLFRSSQYGSMPPWEELKRLEQT